MIPNLKKIIAILILSFIIFAEMILPIVAILNFLV